jgi:tetratricopeptide (TPR) repeat protein
VKQRQLPPGFVEYLSLTDEQRHADYRVRVDRQLREHPEDAAAQLAWMKLLIEDGAWDGAAETARRIAGLKPDMPVLAEAGRALLGAKQCGPAREILQQAAGGSAGSAIRLDLAIATYCTGDAAQALAEMERIPEPDRGGDYYLARAQMLAGPAQNQERRAAIEQALQTAPVRADFYRQAAALLVQSDDVPAALRFLEQGARVLPASREIALLKACALELSGDSSDADHLLEQIRNRWPEWYPGWVTSGIVLKMHGHEAESRSVFDTATALGARGKLHDLDLKSVIAGALF